MDRLFTMHAGFVRRRDVKYDYRSSRDVAIWVHRAVSTVAWSRFHLPCHWLRGSSSKNLEVGFEPTEGFPPHTLSRTAQRRPLPAASIPDQGGTASRVRLWTVPDEGEWDTNWAEDPFPA